MDELTHAIAVDLARVFDRTATAGRRLLATLAWGDKVKVVAEAPNHVTIELTTFRQDSDGNVVIEPRTGYILASAQKALAPLESNRVLKLDFVDVQQGDAAVLETPRGKVMLIDGGDNQLFARYLAARYPGTTKIDSGWKDIDCILVTHGDADHFLGLTKILPSEDHPDLRKRLFIHPRRVFHNGILKRPSTGRRDEELFGATATREGRLYLTELEDDLIACEKEMNQPFQRWKRVLQTYALRGPIRCARLARGDDAQFAFLSESEPLPVDVQVLAPLVEEIDGRPALPMLKAPSGLPRLDEEQMSLDLTRRPRGGYSASHTINGHSVVLRIQYGNLRFLLAGDLNEEAERRLAREHREGRLSLEAEVLKVPHHGSSDFSPAFLKAVAPVVSVVSSGDENKQKEYIHPRANLMGSLGRFSRVDRPMIFVTEMVAFFEVIGFVSPKEADAGGSNAPPRRFFAFRRAAFGTVKVRTDGNRMLVYTNSGQASLKEAYAFTRSPSGELAANKIAQV
ncbi:MAG: MBL fold metallo-hydrolase [Bryobacteraceae bacterium]|nr:MBL fold metallo-hydrolase [Bryobacteraceae bacterium]